MACKQPLESVTVGIGEARDGDTECLLIRGHTGICRDCHDPARLDIQAYVIGPTARQQCFSREYAAH
jgi:hypothetical protein